jgi:ABC-type transport system involved in multi-copper enzyme maturation permease subunit
MTIYGVGYRKLEYAPEPIWRRLQAIAVIEFRSLFRSRWGVALFILCLAPSIVSLVVLLSQVGVLQLEGRPGSHLREQIRHQMASDPHAMRFLPDNLRFYLEPIITESLLPFLVLTGLVSSRSIAKDRAANAMELSWTRGISPRGYFLAKWFGSAGLLVEIGVVAALVLWLIGVLLWQDWSLLETTATFLPQTALALFTFTAVMSYLPVALSALANTPNMASILWVMLLMGSMAAGHVVEQVMREHSWLQLISVWDAAGSVARAIAGVRERSEVLRAAVTNLVVVTAALTVLVVRRMRLREAIG